MWSVARRVSNILTTDLARGLDGRDVLYGPDGTQGTRGAAEASHSNELLRVSSGGNYLWSSLVDCRASCWASRVVLSRKRLGTEQGRGRGAFMGSRLRSKRRARFAHSRRPLLCSGLL